MTDPRVLVKLAGVTKDYPKVATGGERLRTLAALLLRSPDVPHFRALDAIDLEVRKGESLGLVGENGAGKSTLLKIIAGVVRPTRGTVAAAGRIGALLELGSGFHPDYTGRENIYLASALMGLSRREAKEQIDSIVAFADIGEHIDEPIKHYSSGMVVRLGFAVATALKPEILITDEVLAVGDESFQKKCIQWLERYLGDGGTLLLCSHSMFHVQTLCRNALWVHQGRARMYGGAFDVTREYLAYHEEKTRAQRVAARPADGTMPRIERVWTERADGAAQAIFAKGDTLVIQGEAFEPDDRAPVVLVGIVRLDGTPVFGSLTNEGGFEPVRLEARRFGFALRFERLALLPGKYRVRSHALDPQGLRLFDTVEAEFTVTGETRDFGVVELEHAWDAPRSAAGGVGAPGRRALEALRAHNERESRGESDAYGQWMSVDCTIDERDDIFHFFASHPIAANPVREYLSDGWRTLSELLQLLDRCGRPLSEAGSILEFAAGFGRFTRHLAKAAPGRVTCSEIVPGSVEFLRSRFGVEAFASARDPAQIAWPRRFELVFVLSLFTHLPLAAWAAWIRKLADAVEPGGLLVFTTHSPEGATAQGVEMGPDGARFYASSESRALDAGDYGTTFTTRERVLREVAAALPGASVEIHPQAFWHGQDAVVVKIA